MQPPTPAHTDPFIQTAIGSTPSPYRAERRHFTCPGAMREAAQFLDTVGSQWARALHLEARAWEAEIAAEIAR